jgi:hypothetical protein
VSQDAQANIVFVIAWINFILSWSCLAACITFVATYSRSAWRDSLIGRATMYVWSDMTLVFSFVIVSRLLRGLVYNPPPIDWRLWVLVILTTIVYSTLAASLWWKVSVVIRIQRNPDKVAASDAARLLRRREDLDGARSRD